MIVRRDFEGAVLQFAGSGPKRTLEGNEKFLWPDDCPTCGSRMEFDLGAVTARVCACGKRITASDLFNERAPVKRKTKRA